MIIASFKKSIKFLIKKAIFQELFFSGLGCLFFILIFNLLPEDYHFSALSKHNYIPKTICSILILSFFFLFVVLNQKNPSIRFFQVNYKRNIIILSIFMFTLNYYLFFNTDFGLYGYMGDNWFRTAYITKMANSGLPQDFIYKDLSAFYAPLYWYILALIAKIFQIKPYKMIKYGFLFCYYIIPILLFESWKKIYKQKLSFIITLISFFLIVDSFFIDHLISIMFLIPYFIYYFENYTNKEFKFKDYIFAGVIGSALFCIFFLYFLIIPIYYIISIIQNFSDFKKKFKRILIITVFIILFSSWFWVPLLIDIVLVGFESHQNFYFNDLMVQIPFFNDLLPFSIAGIIFFSGLIFVFINYNSSKDIKILGNLLISVFFLFLLGYIGIITKLPFMHIRFIELYMYILIISSSSFYLKMFKFIKNNKNFKKKPFKNIIQKIQFPLLFFIIFSNNYFATQDLYDSVGFQRALELDVPEEIIDIFEELDYEEKVFLTHYSIVSLFLPIYLFLCPFTYFTHPSALYNERIKFLIELSECKNSSEFYEKIIESKFGPIDFFFLDLTNSTYLIFTPEYEKFTDLIERVDIKFDIRLFNDAKYFKEIIIDGKVIYETIY